MEKMYPSYPGSQPAKSEFQKAPLSVLKFISTLLDKIRAMDACLKQKDSLLRQKDAQIKQLISQIKQKDTQLAQKDAKIEKLNKRLNTNSTNSNQPPSKDPPGFDRNANKNPDKPKNKSPEKKKDSDSENESKKPRKAHHPGATQPRLRPTKEENCLPPVCPHCGCRHFTSFSESSLHQHIELLKNPLQVTHFHIFAGKCAECGKVSKGLVPVEFRDYYGPRLSAFIALIDSLTGTTRRQLQVFLKDVFGFSISQGGIQKTIDRASEAIRPHYESIGAGVRKSLYNHSDETSWRTHDPVLHKLLHWLWFLGCAFLAFFRIDPHRDAEAFKTMVKDWRGLLISDEYSVYVSWEGLRQTCLAHYLREAKKMAESDNAEEAKCGKRIISLLKDLCSLKNEPLPQNFLTNLESRTNRLFNDFGDLPGKAGNLVLHLYKDLETVTLFLRDPLATPTNNFAERMVRAAVCKRKISIGSAAEKGERWIERSLTVRKSCALNNRSYYSVLTDAIASQTRGGRPNLYWIHKASIRVTQKEFLVCRPH